MPRGCSGQSRKETNRNNELPSPEYRPTAIKYAESNKHAHLPNDDTETGPPEFPNPNNLHTTTPQIKPEILEFFLLNIEGINPNIPKKKRKIKALDDLVNQSDYKIPFFAITSIITI